MDVYILYTGRDVVASDRWPIECRDPAYTRRDVVAAEQRIIECRDPIYID
jgi:hypothetical protein